MVDRATGRNAMKRVDASDVAALVTCLQSPGGVALVPTETVYGLVACADDSRASERIYRIKSRDTSKRLQWFVDGIPMLRACGAVINASVAAVIERFCPGPLMLIVPALDGATIGFRIPDQPLILDALKVIGKPLCATSANRSGEKNCVDPDSALTMFDEMPDLVVDGGVISSSGLASTIVDFTTPEPRCLREGTLAFADVCEVFHQKRPPDT